MQTETPIIGFLRYSQARVQEALAEGEPYWFEEALPTMFDEFFSLADALGVLQAIDQLPDPRKRDGYIPLTLACSLAICRFLYGLTSWRRVGKVLLRDHALLQRLGVLPMICNRGYYRCERADGEDGPETPHKPFTEQRLTELLAQIELDELIKLLTEFVKHLRERRPQWFEKGLFSMDSNHFTTRGTKKEAAAEYKWCALMLHTPLGMIPVLMEFSPTDGEGTGETSVGRRLLECALKTYGEGFIKSLLIDTGYVDGKTLLWLKEEHKIDWTLDPKEDMHVTKGMLQAIHDKPRRPWLIVDPPKLELPKGAMPTRRVMWVGERRNFTTYGKPVNGCVIWDHYPKSKQHPEGHDHYQCLVTTHMEWKGVQIHDHGRLRWEIENTFGAMTNTWGLGEREIGTLAVYRATILFMALVYGLLVTYLREARLKLSLGGIRDRLQRQAKGKVLVVCGRAAAVVTPVTLNEWHKRGLLRGPAP